MKAFMDEDFLLQTDTARHLYHEHAALMPIYDYHCHINPREIAENREFRNIAQAWLGSDTYKWRLLRSNGVDEGCVSGSDVSSREKFQYFAESLSRAIGNPLYHWTHLELKRYFDCDLVLNGENAEKIWDICNERLLSAEMRAQGIIKQSNVQVICTTDDPASDLKWHKKIQQEGTCPAKVLPTFRADSLLNIEVDGWDTYMRYELGESADMDDISTMQDIRDAVVKRLDYFASQGCQIADQSLPYMAYAPAREFELDDVVGKVINGKGQPSKEAMEQYKTAMLMFLGEEYARRGWAMQLHYSALRDTNSTRLTSLGSDSGFDAVDTHNCAPGLAKFLDALDKAGHLPKTIICSLNPADNIVIASLLPSFTGSEVLGKVQQGAAWWFNNNKAGIEAQLATLASVSVLGNTIGAPTDSRSLLSYSRHEYYRRILCNFIGNMVENGEYPADMKTLGKLVEDISYNNACRYFAF